VIVGDSPWVMGGLWVMAPFRPLFWTLQKEMAQRGIELSTLCVQLAPLCHVTGTFSCVKKQFSIFVENLSYFWERK
jgi:hypothetical protein